MKLISLFIVFALISCAHQPKVRKIASSNEAFSHIDPSGLIRSEILEEALVARSMNADVIKNNNYMVVVDFAKDIEEERFYLINLVSGEVESSKVSHGRGSTEGGQKSQIVKFSNATGSHASVKGALVTGKILILKKAEQHISVKGLQVGINDNSTERMITIMGSDYVNNGGLSAGSFALPKEKFSKFKDQMSEGTFIYSGK